MKEATIENLQNANRQIEIVVSLDGKEQQSRSVRLEANSKAAIDFEVTALEKGIHVVSVNGRQTTFFVTDPVLVTSDVDTPELSIQLHASCNRCKLGDEIVLTLSAVSKRTHDKPLQVQVILQVPSGMAVTGGQGWSIGPQATFDRELQPGSKEETWLRIKPGESGVFLVKGKVNYSLGGERVERTVQLTVTVAP